MVSVLYCIVYCLLVACLTSCTTNSFQYGNIVQKKEQASQHLETAWKYLKQAEWSDALLYARKANKENFRLVEPYFFEAANALIQAKYMHALSWFQKVKILFPNHMWTKEEIAGHKTAFWREIVQLLREDCPQQALKRPRSYSNVF